MLNRSCSEPFPIDYGCRQRGAGDNRLSVEADANRVGPTTAPVPSSMHAT